MRLEQIRQVLELAKTGSFSQAARNLYMSQPNLSQSIRQLEDELGCPLFIRKSTGVIPTEEGSTLIREMAVIDAKVDHLVHQKDPVQTKTHLKVASLYFPYAVLPLIRIVQKYLETPVEFAFIECHSFDEILEKVSTCQVDLALIGIMSPYYKTMRNRLTSHQMEFHELSKHQVKAILGPENEFYDRTEPLRLEELKNQTLVTFSDEVTNPEHCIINSSYTPVEPRGTITVSSRNLYYELIRNTAAIGIAAPVQSANAQNADWAGLRTLPISDFPNEGITGWIRHCRLPLSEVASELIEKLEEAVV